MSDRTWNNEIKELGDKIVGLTLMQAKELADYLKEVHGIEPAAGGAVMMAGPAAAAAAPAEEKTSFDVDSESSRRQENPGHQGSQGIDRLRSERSKGPCRGSAEACKTGLEQGRGRCRQEAA